MSAQLAVVIAALLPVNNQPTKSRGRFHVEQSPTRDRGRTSRGGYIFYTTN